MKLEDFMNNGIEFEAVTPEQLTQAAIGMAVSDYAQQFCKTPPDLVMLLGTCYAVNVVCYQRMDVPWEQAKAMALKALGEQLDFAYKAKVSAT